MERHAGGHGMSDTLRQEILSYQLCMLDDTVQEAVHRDVSHISGRVPASKVPYRAAALRLEQNLAQWDRCAGSGADTDTLRSYKAVLQLKPDSYRTLTPVRMPLSDFLQRVYRSGQHSLEYWGSLADMMAAFLKRRPVARVALADELKSEYLRSVLVPGLLYTCPRDPDNCPADTVLQPLPEAARRMEAFGADIGAWQVLDMDVARKRFIRTGFAHRVRSMCVPVSVQPHVVHSRGQYPSQELQVTATGPPDIVDATQLAPWPLLRCALRQWGPLGPADTPMCLTAGHSELVAARALGHEGRHDPGTCGLGEAGQ
jgi:hypothetical protein